jgi:hypothetical protein
MGMGAVAHGFMAVFGQLAKTRIAEASNPLPRALTHLRVCLSFTFNFQLFNQLSELIDR